MPTTRIPEKNANTASGFAFLVCMVFLGLFACASRLPPNPQLVQSYLTVITPDGPGKFPVVIFYQGTGGGDRRAKKWAAWFKKKGVASAMVDNAGMRGVKALWGVDDYTIDAAMAWDRLKANKKIDTSRFALMGFSRGGRQALLAGPDFGGPRAIPDFVFAFYPGGGPSNTCFIKQRKTTKVHIFYGDLDAAGKGPGQFFYACQREAEGTKNVEFHEIKGAHHGYDEARPGSFYLPGTTILVPLEPNPRAVEETKAIIWQAIKKAWHL